MILCVQFCKRNCNRSIWSSFFAANIANQSPTQVKLSISNTNILHPTSVVSPNVTSRCSKTAVRLYVCCSNWVCLLLCLTSAPFIPCSHAALCFWNNTCMFAWSYTHTHTHCFKLNVSKYWHSPVDASWSASWGIIYRQHNCSLICRSHTTQNLRFRFSAGGHWVAV